jgi:hypothetical protein
MERTEEQIFPACDNTEPIEFPTDETEQEKEIRLLKEKALKAKVIALEQLRKPIFSNPSLFSNREKAKLLKVMKEWFDKPDEEVDEIFNDLVLDKLDGDYENIGVNPLNISYAPDPEFHKNLPPMVIDIAGNTLNTINSPN